MLSQLVRNLQLEPADIAQRRCEIATRVMRESSSLRDINFSTINTRDLFDLFCHYDELFFEGQLTPKFENPDCDLSFRLSSRMTSTGGMTTYRRQKKAGRRFRRATTQRQFEIAVSSTLLFNTEFPQPSVKVGGVPAHHRLDALQRIFEHELVHLIEMLLWEESSCAKRRFKSIVHRCFGHLASNHQLVTPSDTAKTKLGFSIGDWVRFQYRGAERVGFVNGINRRATILVPDIHGERFDDQQCYQRYYVPLERVRPLRSASVGP